MRCELALVVILASCGDRPSQVAAAPPPAPVTVRQDARTIDAAGEWAEETLAETRALAAAVATLPPLYAPIFAGTSPQFPGETMYELPLEIREHGEIQIGKARCYVRPAVLPGGVQGSLICAPFGMGGQVLRFSLDVVLVGTSAGLWLESRAIDDASQLDPKRMVIAASPRPKRTVLVDPENPPRTTVTVTQQGEVWCITAVSQNREYLCLRPGAGIVGGGGSGAGMGSDKRIESWGFVPEGTR